MNEVDPEIKITLKKINDTWGGEFIIEFIENWRETIKRKKSEGVKIVHLTMYGENIKDIENKIENEKNILIVVGAEKVPREIYDFADYNVAIGNQPHSEISSLAVLLDRIQNGDQFLKKFKNAQRKIVPSKQGKKVVMR